MVTIFSIHLSTQIFGDSENCGCFGDLIPMTPLESFNQEYNYFSNTSCYL